MSVKIDPSGRRSIQVEVEVPGTPEQVWEAIATGPGVSSWFVPTEMEGRVGGIMTCHFAPGMDSKATITSWDPPHRLTADSESFCPGGPTVATEWTVEARSGGTCVVRVVHSLFASASDWDDQLGGHRIRLARLLPHSPPLSHALSRPGLRDVYGDRLCLRIFVQSMGKNERITWPQRCPGWPETPDRSRRTRVERHRGGITWRQSSLQAPAA